MQSTSVHPVALPNLCFCGHPFAVHAIVSGGTANCLLCKTSSAVTPNQHIYTGYHTLSPIAFASSDLPRMIAAGGLGQRLTGSTALSGNNAGSSTLGFTTLPAPVGPGWSVTTFPTATFQSATYTILARPTATTLTITPPLRFGAISTQVVFQGIAGSGMGAACPPNGQRAG